jgi:hypothetical protein
VLSECEDLTIDDFELTGRYMTATVFEALGGDPNIARARAELGLEAARRLGNPSQLAGMLWATGYALERQDPAAALRAFAESAALVRAGANDTNFGATLAHLAVLRDQEGDHVGALGDLLEAVDYFERSGPRAELVVVIARASRLLADHGQPDASAILAGVLTVGPLASMAATNTGDRMVRASAAARQQLGDAYDLAFRRGAAMSYDEAIAYAHTTLEHALGGAETGSA